MTRATQLLTKADYRRLAAFRAALRQFLAFSEGAARAVGLAPQQHQALLAIKGHPNGGRVSIGDLAVSLGIRPNTAVELADRLVAAGLVRRSGSPDDGRRVLLALTAKAERLLADLSGAHLEELRRMAPMLADLLAGLRGSPEPAPPAAAGDGDDAG
ncbi:MAG TPA: MarR family transcriptional regulator [Hyphomicrobiales bacterium]|nr:MarR family transcriptional regulator [Hyphomicrobiales bacterium]